MSVENNQNKKFKIPPNQDDKTSERKEIFLWRNLEKLPEFRALMVHAIELGALPRDIATLLREHFPEHVSTPPTSEQITAYYLGTKQLKRALKTRADQLRSLGIPEDVNDTAYADVREYMRVNHPARLWLFARDTRAVAVYLLETEDLSQHGVGRALSKYLDADIGENTVNLTLRTFARPLRSKHPNLTREEIAARAKEQLIRQLKKDLSPIELLEGRLEGKRVEELFRLEKHGRPDSWKRDRRSRLLVAALFKNLTVDIHASKIASEVITNVYGIPLGKSTLAQFFDKNRAQRTKIIEDIESSATTQELQHAARDATLAIDLFNRKQPILFKSADENQLQPSPSVKALEANFLIQNMIATMQAKQRSGTFFTITSVKHIDPGNNPDRDYQSVVITLVRPTVVDGTNKAITAYDELLRKLTTLVELTREGEYGEFIRTTLEHYPNARRLMLRWSVRGNNPLGALRILRSSTCELPNRSKPGT